MANVIEIVIKGIDETSKAIGSSSASLQKMGKTMTKVGGAMTIGLTVPIVAGMGAMVNAAMESENELAELNAVLASTKGVAGVTADELIAQANALQQVTKFGDEAILSGQSMLLTFTNIGKDVFPDATVALLNMAEKFGSMDVASVQLGKALNDPIQGVTALRRIGVQLSDAQEQQIKDFMAVGDVASAQRIILGELETQLGGLAVAAGQTTAGQMAIMKNQLGELSEDLGKELIPLLIEIIPILIDFVKWLRESDPVIKKLILAGLGLIAVLGPILSMVGSAITVFTALSGTVLPAVGAALAAVSLPVIALVAAIGLLIATILIFGKDAWNTITMISAIMRQLLVNAVEWVVGRWTYGFNTIVGAIRDVINWIGSLGSKLSGLRLPSWLTPGSPTPFEMGLRGISSAMAEISRNELPKFSSGLNIAAPMQAGFAGAGAGGVNVYLTYSPTVSLMDRSEAETKLVPYIEAALRKIR
jgi:hypothetical protein